jgi:hypothetical protein
MALIVQNCGVVGTLIAATIGVRSYINSNKGAEEVKKKEQETRERSNSSTTFSTTSSPSNHGARVLS